VALMDRITLEGIEVYAHHGVHPAERELGQRFIIDVEVWNDCEPAALNDDLALAVDYAALHGQVRRTATAARHQLIETLAVHLCRDILHSCGAARASVTVRKPHPPIPDFAGSASVRVERDRAWAEGDGA